MSIIADLKKGELNRRLIFILLLIVIELPILMPLGTPIQITEPTRKFYEYVKNIPDDSVVLFDTDFGVMSWPPHGPMATVVLTHLFQKNIKVVIVSFGIEGPIITDKILATLDLSDKEYGIDYVHIGYIPGWESGMGAFAQNTHISQVDSYGASLDTLPLMDEVNSIEDFYCVAWDSATSMDPYFRQWPIPQLGCSESGGVPQILPYYNTGALVAYLNGILGASEYETLQQQPGFGTAQMDAISTSHMFGILLLIITNYKFLKEKIGGGKK